LGHPHGLSNQTPFVRECCGKKNGNPDNDAGTHSFARLTGKNLFRLLPPIRPVGYEHIRHKNIIERMLRENTLAFNKEDRGLSPITGFSCWALGYLDEEYRRIGCLLHPFQNDGVDLRYRVDYGSKCCRESCPESKTFSDLDPCAKEFLAPPCRQP
jgi:hypothetical protein